MKTLRLALAAMGLLLASAVPSQAALITYNVTFDEYLNTPVSVPGLKVFEPDGEFTTVSYFAGPGATFGYGGVQTSIFPNISTPFLEGASQGTVFFAFSSPVSNLSFDIGLVTFFDVPNDYTVTIFETGVVGPAATVPVNVTAVGSLPYDHFEYELQNSLITGFAVNFNPAITSFAIDNLFASNAAVPEVSTLALGGIVMAGAGLVGYRRRRRSA